jgi:uncharacterized protein
MSSIQIVQDVYRAFGRGDIPAVLAAFDRDVEWRLAEGHPYAPEGRPWIGPEAIRQHFFARAGGEWDGFSISPREFHAVGDAVVLECRYAGVYKPTGQRLDAQACHVWKVRNGKIASFQQYIDTAQLQQVMGRGPARTGD